MKFTVLTSFNPDGYEKYGKRFVESFRQFWPKDVPLLAYGHDFEKPPQDVINLNEASPQMLAFKEKYKAFNGGPPEQYNYRLDALKFCHKMFAIFHAAMTVKEGYLIWLDGDIFTTKEVPSSFLEEILGGEPDIVHLGRNTISYSETSFIALNMESNAALEFLADFQELYLNGELFAYKEWHDGFVFERLLKLHQGHGLKAKNIAPTLEAGTLDAFQKSDLGKYMTHLKGNLKEPKKAMPVKIVPRNAVADEVLLKNIDENRKVLKHYVKKCYVHDTPAIIVSGGPSIKENVDKIKELREEMNATIFCVKHSHNFLLANNIPPKFCVLLDPRPYDGLSTHGEKRSELIAKPDKRVVYLVASMVDPFVAKHLMSHDIKPLGWHAWTGAIAGIKLPDDQFFVTGGTCAAVRSVGLAHTMGFRAFHLFGFDSSWPTEPDLTEKDEQGRTKFFKASGAGAEGKHRWTTGELLSQAQDVEELLKRVDDMDLSITFHGEGLVQDLASCYPPSPREHYRGWITTL